MFICDDLVSPAPPEAFAASEQSDCLHVSLGPFKIHANSDKYTQPSNRRTTPMTTSTTQHHDREADAVRCYGDLLRNMSNEELARYLYIESNRMSETEWLEWLDRGLVE